MPNWYLRSCCLVLSIFSIVNFQTMKLVPKWILYKKYKFQNLSKYILAWNTKKQLWLFKIILNILYRRKRGTYLSISVNMIFEKTNKLKPQPTTDIAVVFQLLTLKRNSFFWHLSCPPFSRALPCWEESYGEKMFLISVLQSTNFKLNKNHCFTVLPYFHRITRGLN